MKECCFSYQINKKRIENNPFAHPLVMQGVIKLIYLELIAAILLILAFIKYLWSKKENEYKTSLLATHIQTSTELKKTLAMGLYLRFCKELDENIASYSSLYIKQDPIEFEAFVADVIQKVRGGTTWVTPTSGDYGVDFEHETKEGLLLGQVKCYKNDLPFDSIALIHSNMVKRGAAGGYVITTASFTSKALEYANGLNIELIDGVKLVSFWLASLSNAEQEIKELIPDVL